MPNNNWKVTVGAELDKSAGKQIQDGLNKVMPKPIEVPFKIDFKNSKEIENEMKRLVSKLTKGKGSLSDFKIDTSTIFDDDLGKRIEKLNGVTIKYKNELGEVISELYKFNQIGSNIDSSGQEEIIMGWSKAMSSYSQNTEKATNNLMRQKELVEQMKLLQIQADKSGTTLNQENISGFDTANKNNNIKEMTHYLKLAKTEYSQLNAMMEKDLPISGLENMKKNIGTMPIDIQNVETSFKKLQVQPEELRTRIDHLGNSFKSLESFKGAEADKVKQYNLLKGEITGVTKEVKSLIAVQQQQISLDDKTKFSSSITSWSNDNTKGAKLFRVELERIQRELIGADKTKFTSLKKEFQSIQKQTEAMGKSGRTAFQELGNNFKKFASWYGIAGVVTSAVRGIKQMVSTVVELDKSLVDLQQATGFTAEETGKLLNTYIDLGQELGATGTEVAQAADVWLRQGKSLAETNTLIRDSIILSKIGQVDSAKATQYLTSAMKGYKLEASEVLSVIDKMASVDLISATSIGGLAEAMSRTANGARIAGVEMDKLLGMLAVVGEVSQKSMDSVGESFKTIFARMGNVKLGKLVDEDGNDITTEINDVEKILNKVDIKLRVSATEFRNFGNVLDDVGKDWSKFNAVEQNAIASAFAGVRQRESFVTLMENYGDSLKYAEISANSAGTAMDKFSAYEESVEAKTKRLQASLQELAVGTLDSSVVKGFLDLANGVVKATTTIGGLVPVIITLGILLPTLKASFGTLNLSLIATQIQTFGLATAFKTLIGTITTFMATNPVGWILLLGTAVFGVKKIYDHFNVTLEEHQEILSQQAQAYDDATANVKSLEGELESTRLKLEELNAIGGASVVKDGEQERLEKQTEELQRHLDIARETQRIAAEEAEKTAINTLNKTISSEFETYSDPSNRMGRITYDNVTRDVELQRIMDKYDKILGMQTELKKKQQELANNKEGNFPEFKANEEQLESLDTRMTELKTRANELVGELQNEKESLVGVTEEGNVLKESINGVIDVYRSWMGSSKDINETNDNVTETMSNSVETIEEQAKALETQNKAIDEYQKSISSIGKALSDLDKLSPSDIIDLMQQFPQLAEYGYTGSEGMDVLKVALEKVGNQLYNNLDPSIKNVELFKQMYKEAMTASDSISAFSFSISVLNTLNKSLDDLNKKSKDTVSSVKELNQVLYDQSQGTKLTSEQAYKLITQYPQLASALEKTTDGYTINEEAIENVRLALINQEEANANAQLNMTKDTLNAVSDRVEAYGIELESITTLQSALNEQSKLPFEKIYGSMEGFSFDDVTKRITTPTGSFIADATSTVYDSIKGAYQEQKLIHDTIGKMGNLQERINGLQNDLLSDKGFGVNKGKGGSSSGSSKDLIKEAFDLGTKDKKGKWITGKNDLDHDLAMEEITQKQYLKGLEKINEATFGQAQDTHLEQYRQYVAEVYKGRKKIDEDNIKSKFDDLSHSFAMGDIKSEEKYQKKRWKLAKKYYKNNEDYLDEWKKAQEEWYKWNLDKAEETAKNQEKIAENLKDKYTDLINEITDEINKEKDNVLDGLNEGHETTIKNLEKQKDNYREIVNAQIDLLDAKKKQNDYEKSIANKTKEISKIESRKSELQKAAMSGDRQANAELKKLEEDLANKKEDLLDEQSDHEYDLQKESLNNALDLNDKLMDARIDAENTRFETQKSNIEKLYDKEIELISKAAQYTKDEFGRALDEIATQLASNGVTQSSDYLGVVKQSQSSLAGSEINTSTANRSAILAILSNGTGKDYKEEASALASYTRDNYGNPISKKQAVEVAKLLGVEGINSVSDLTGNDENKEKIRRALIKAKFHEGGYVDANILNNKEGYALVKHGEPILTVEQGKLFKELVNNMKPLNNLVKLSTPNISNITNKTTSPNINITIPITGNATPSTVSALNNAGNNIVKQIMDEVRKM